MCLERGYIWQLAIALNEKNPSSYLYGLVEPLQHFQEQMMIKQSTSTQYMHTLNYFLLEMIVPGFQHILNIFSLLNKKKQSQGRNSLLLINLL